MVREMEKSKTKGPRAIEYETVTLKIPKPIMEWLRRMQPLTRMAPVQKLEYEVVDFFRAELESRCAEELVPCLDIGLAQVFVEILGDKRYGL
jgi:hypothetical protein